MVARSSPSRAAQTRRGALPVLRSRADFDRIESKGRTRTDRLLIIRFVPNDLDHDRFGISTGRRLGNAVQRNRVRRRVREILRPLTVRDGDGWDVLVVARPASVGATFEELRTALERLLGAMRAGRVRGSS